MALTAFSLTQVTQRLVSMMPQRWFSSTALKLGGNLYALMNAVGTAHTALSGMIAYTALQTRITTATDTNLETIARDYLGPGNPRYNINLSGATLSPETDAQFSARIRAEIVQTQDTIQSIQTIVQSYINNLYVQESVNNAILFGLDDAGGLDTRGGLDGRPSSVPVLPKVYVFDWQSDPISSAKIGLVASEAQFCICFVYGGLTHDGFFLGSTFLGQGSHLITPQLQVVPVLTSTLDAIVNACRAVGTQQIYADNRSA